MAETQVISTIPDGHDGRNTTAEIAAAPCGRHLYVSNRGQDSVVLFNIAAGTGRLAMSGTRPPVGSGLGSFAWIRRRNDIMSRIRTVTKSPAFVSIR